MQLIVQDRDDCYAFSTFFYLKLASDGYDGVSQWAKKDDIFSKRLLFVPVHLDVHWCLVAVNMELNQISYYDSFAQE